MTVQTAHDVRVVGGAPEAGRAGGIRRSATSAWLLVQSVEGSRDAVITSLRRMPGVRGWQETSGAYDFVVELAVGDPEAGWSAAQSALQALPGVGHVVCCRPGYGAGDTIVLS